MTFAGPLYAFLLLNVAMIVVTEVLIISHLATWFEEHFTPKKTTIEDEWWGMHLLEMCAEEFSIQLPESFCGCATEELTNDEKFDNSLRSLRTAALVRCVAGGMALLLAPAFTAMLLGHVGLV